MPMFLFKCTKCNNSKKVLSYDSAPEDSPCSECDGTLTRKIGGFVAKIAPTTREDIQDDIINPFVKSTMEKIGKELLAGDTNTLENVFGEKALKDTFYEEDTYEDETIVLRNNGLSENSDVVIEGSEIKPGEKTSPNITDEEKFTGVFRRAEE